MFIQYSWIKSRRRILVSAIFDLIIVINLYNFVHLDNFGVLPSRFVTYTIAAFWISISYIIGRYMKVKRLNKESIIKNLIKTFFLFLLCNLIYILINLGYLLIIPLTVSGSIYINFNKILFYSFLESTLYIALLSHLFQNILSIITHRIYNYEKKWLFVGSELTYQEIIREISLKKKEINLLFASENYEFNEISYKNIEGIIFNNFENINDEKLEFILKLKLKGLKVINLLDWFEKEFNRVPTNINYDKYKLIEKIKSAEYNYELRIKRFGDIFVSLLLIILFSPILLIIGTFIYLEDGNAIFYTQKRTGLNGKEIRITKFRSMKINAEKDGIQWSIKNDPRITKVGRLIRATRLDELPQLFAVIKGDMSLIGPRPERPEIEEKFLKNIPFYNYRNILKPGLSGWAQVNYSYGASVFDSTQKLSYDIYYIINFSFFLDLLILFKTIKLILNLKGYKPNL